MSSQATRRTRGFTLLEMMVVVSIILILLGIAIPVYSHSMLRAREDNLRQNLDTLNQAIYQYALDKQKMPKSLDDLKSAGYIDKVPDDITGGKDWVPEQGEDIIMSLDQTDAGGIIGVHSGSNQLASDGTEYAKW
jgi:prepilin-type N-terminal cleavage/methylation domain-containing protein